MDSLMDRHSDHVLGQLQCLDRVVITGTLRDLVVIPNLANPMPA